MSDHDDNNNDNNNSTSSNNHMEESVLFDYTSNLHRHDVPRNVTQIQVLLEVLPVWALSKLAHLKAVEFPMGFRIIGKSAFLGCTSLQELALPPSTKEIRAGGLAGCMKLTTVHLNHGLEAIWDSAFQHCRMLAHISMPPTVNALGNLAFHGCHSLCLVHLPEGLQFLGRSVFMQCHSLVQIYIPFTVNYIGAYCFKDCFELQSIELPPNGQLQMIRIEAFRRCSNLRNICISPETVLEGGYHQVFDYDSLLLSEEEDGIPDLDLNLDPEFMDIETMEWSTLKNEKPISLQNRYENLPIHKLCYCQAHWSSMEQDSGRGRKSILDEMERLIMCHESSSTMDGQVSPGASKMATTTRQQDHLLMTPLHVLALSAKPNFALWKLVFRAFPGDLLVKDKWGKEPFQYLLQCSIENDSSIDIILQHATPARLQNRLEVFGKPWRTELLECIRELLPRNTATRATRLRSANQVLTMVCKFERMEALSLLESAVWKAQWQRMEINKERKTKGMTNMEERPETITIKVPSTNGLNVNRHEKDWKMARETCRLQCGSEVVVFNVMQFLDPLVQFTLTDPIARF